VSGSLWSKKRKVLHHYNRLAGIYDSLYGEEQKSKIESILKLLSFGCKDMVLDAGCGTGLLIEYIAVRVNHLVGVDLAGESLKIAIERSRRLGVKRKVSLLRADVDHLPFRDAVFDKVFALTLLQNVPEPCETLREMLRVTKSNSQVAVTGLKKHFTEENFSRLIRRIGREYVFAETEEPHDIIAVVKADKVKNKYRQKEGIER